MSANKQTETSKGNQSKAQVDALVIPPIVADPCRWEILEQFYPSYGKVAGGVYIERRSQRNGDTKYAVVLRDTWELSWLGDWDYMPQPSSRDDNYLSNHRFDKLDDAIAAAQIACELIVDEAKTMAAV